MLGGIGHALVSAVEEAFFFHAVTRRARPEFEIKGFDPLTEHYSVLGPEVLRREERGPDPTRLLSFDAVVFAGQAKSHCVAWTIDDLLRHPDAEEQELARRMYLLEDCTSPVVVPGVVDYTEEADAAVRALPRRRHARRAVDRPDRELARQRHARTCLEERGQALGPSLARIWVGVVGTRRA